jgi:hypothetical protein
VGCILLASAARAGGGLVPPGNPTLWTGYAVVWIEAESDSRIASTSSLAGFLLDDADFQQQGFQLVDFETNATSSNRRFAGIWHPAPPEAAGFAEASHLVLDLPIGALEAEVGDQGQLGYRLADLEVYFLNGNLTVAGVFHPDPSIAEYLVDLDEAQLMAAKQQLGLWDFQMIDVEAYLVNGERRFAAVWHRSTEVATVVAVDQPWDGLLDLSVGLVCSRHLFDLELVPSSLKEDEWQASGLWGAPVASDHVLFPASWAEVEAFQASVPPGAASNPLVTWLPIDIEILWHAEGGGESSLTVSHDGPMTPPGS